ncbi:twin-arginine translocase TatA/TatE family subunit [Pseudoclavibacter chungangensis]|uniref:Sec-independent protein translocase protein TatA n=1 Tax=Pseudoclavibacter chungangensis TaxID=587635 RepID=A0A7J5C083_9MICO|nr:twin-arginine translocase TatA/TatE family subunit [Pseudoclavibacter chungangensis]KAB1660176.1 twin-arginine translocase TatA/TatE family subunit [Pseudoclavibacter chungangensis]NYJ66710.1 sec-independent protein translocase protein TatA [Pseudoclavibacter chungangensis]
MFANLSGWHFLILLVIILLLFGAPKLPALAKSLGQSMRILRGEMRSAKEESAADQKTDAGRVDTAAADPTPAASGDVHPGRDGTRPDDRLGDGTTRP